MFIPNFSRIAAPLTRLTRKDVPFQWTEECCNAVRQLKKAVITAPVLVRPNTSKQFKLEVDTSQLATGAILYQCDAPVTLPSGKEKPGPQCPVGFHSQKFTPTEQNYLIYNREFLAIMHGLCNWSHLLKGTEIPILVYTDHANLRYYCNPRKIGPCIAGYLLEREQYNILLEYKPGATNRADRLSQQENYDTGSNLENEDVIVWPQHYFCEKHTRIHVLDWDSIKDGLE